MMTLKSDPYIEIVQLFIRRKSDGTNLIIVKYLLQFCHAHVTPLACSPTYQYFIRSKNCVLNFTTIRYSLRKCCDTILC